MSALEQWYEQNDRYLGAALYWLRKRLALLVEGDAEPAEEKRSSWSGLFRRDPTESEPLSGAETNRLSAEQSVVAARQKMDQAAEMDPPPALIVLSERFRLSTLEQEVLLLCVAMELDPRMADLCARAQGSAGRPYPTFALALHLFDNPAWDILSPERPLRYWQLLEINQPGNEPLTTSSLRADERIVSYIKGLSYLDDRLIPLLAPLPHTIGRPTLPESQEATANDIKRQLEMTAGMRRTPIVQLVGPDPKSKHLVAIAAATDMNLHLFRMPVTLLPTRATELETMARLWERESMLMPLVLYMDAGDLDGTPAANESLAALQRFLVRCNGVFWLDTPEIQPDLGSNFAVVHVARPSPVEQRRAWADELGLDAADELPTQLAGQFNLNLDAIQQATRAAQIEAHSDGRLDPKRRLWRICLSHACPQLGGLAQRLEPKATWNEIVLPDRELVLLRQIAEQVGQRSRVYDDWGYREKMNRGFGISALFGGESGTGKTMAAEVIANHLDLHLYRIDLSSVVSKYIGETEKNLRRLFDAAEDGGAILFFDEADSLFGKRSEVKDSHDRYANIQINYLLQRMESYQGLAILATNMKTALDKAFLRRLRFIVNFPFPGPAERRWIWRGAFPADTPVEGLDYDWLCRLNLTGGSIHNVALNAAFSAAQAGVPVTMPVILETARVEFHKLERPYNDADLQWAEPVLVGTG